MSSIDNWQIQKACRQKLLTIPGIPDDKAWENVNFEPTSETPWIRETHLPGQERPTANNEVEQVGIMQYDFFYPSGSGVKTIKETADAVKEAFHVGLKLNSNLRVESSTVTRGENESPWYSQILRVNYTAYGQIQ